MSPPPVRARRPVVERPDEDSGGRRGCVTVGAILGVIAGALIAFLALPPLFSHYFGAADIELGKSYAADGRVLQVIESARQPGSDGQLYPGVFVVRLQVTANKTWA